MGKLEPGFSRLHWPPLVKSITNLPTFPGYRYEFFKTFKELDEYMTQECGPDWREQAWCKFWRGQHEQTKHDDRVENKATDHTPIKNTGPRRDSTLIYKLALEAYATDPKISSRQLVKWISTKGIVIGHDTAWRLISKLRKFDAEASQPVLDTVRVGTDSTE